MSSAHKIDTPLLRVSRPVSACQRCRSAKVKCDGKLPACTACEKAGKKAECSSANDQFARGKERSYVASLETRVERLEKQLTQAKARRISTGTDLAQPQPQPQRQCSPSVGPNYLANGGKLQRKEASDVNDLVSDFGFLSVNATARDFHGFTKEMSFARLVLSASSLEPMPQFSIGELPPRHAIKPFIQHYLENIHVLYPFLSETRLFACIDTVYQDVGQYATSMDRWTVRMVLAISYTSLSQRRGDTHFQEGLRHAAAALDHIEVVVHPGSIAGIQAILLMALYSLLDHRHFSSWYLIGLASRVMVDIGLHQDAPHELHLKDSELDIRRRVYGCVYALDRSISMIRSRGFSFTDDSANVTPSVHRRTKAPATNHLFFHGLDPAIQLSQLRKVQSHVYQKLFHSQRLRIEDARSLIWSSLHKLHRWSSELPDQISIPVKQLFRSDVLYSSILIMSPPELTSTINEDGKFLIMEYAVEYAELMSSVCTNSVGFAFYTSDDVLRVSFVAERFLTVLLNDSGVLFGGSRPRTCASTASSPGPPPIPSRGTGELLNRAYKGLDLLKLTLERLGLRYGLLGPLNEFNVNASDVRHSLQVTYERWKMSTNYDQHSQSS